VFSPSIQQYFSTFKVPYGVQFETAHLVTLNRLRLENITFSKLETLCGTNAQRAPETAKVFFEHGFVSDSTQDPAFAQETAARVSYIFIL
jgi:hypothetical protein